MSSLNGHYNTHDVIITDTCHGERIKGRLSDFKGDLRHLWSDTETKLIKVSTKTKANSIIAENPNFLTFEQAAEWLKNTHGIDKPTLRLNNYLNRKMLTRHYVDSGRGKLRISKTELEKLGIGVYGRISRNRKPTYNKSLTAVAYLLRIPMVKLREAVKLGRLKTRLYGNKEVYFFDDARKAVE